MLQSPTYIHFRNQFQIIGPDAPGQRFPRDLFQRLMQELNDDPVRADFDNFAYHSGTCELTKLRESGHAQGQAFSKLAFQDDRLTIVEEWTDLNADEFSNRSVQILKVWFKIFPMTIAIHQQSVLRALLQPQHETDARTFIGDRLTDLGPKLQQHFEQMPCRVGIQATVVRQSEQASTMIDLAFGSWRNNRDVWAEVDGKTVLNPPMNATASNRAATAFATCKDFFEKEVYSLFQAFDKPSGTPQEGNT